MLLGAAQPPEGPPICTALNFLPSRMPPPMSKMTSRRVVPMGTSIRPVFTTLPVRAKALVPGLFSVPMLRYQSAPRRMMQGTLAKVSTLLRTVGLCPQAVLDGARGLDARHAALALDGGGQGAALAADERACAAVDVDAGNQSRCRGYCRPAGPAPLPWRWRSSGAPRPGDTRRGHRYSPRWLPAAAPAIIMPSSTRVGVALHDGAVHERAGVALVAVADDVLLRRRSGGVTLVPLAARRGSRRRRGPRSPEVDDLLDRPPHPSSRREPSQSAA